MRRGALAATGLAISTVLVVGACQNPTYDAERACSVPTDTVSALLDTDRFTASQEEIEGLPFRSTSTSGSAACHADADDLSVNVRALVVPQAEAARHTASITEKGDGFDLAGGIARADGTSGAWACGSVWVTVWLDGEHEADPQDMRAAVESVAEAASCYTA